MSFNLDRAIRIHIRLTRYARLGFPFRPPWWPFRRKLSDPMEIRVGGETVSIPSGEPTYVSYLTYYVLACAMQDPRFATYVSVEILSVDVNFTQLAETPQ